VAVVVPNHERVETLVETLASIAAQDYPGETHTYLAYRPREGFERVLDDVSDSVTPIPVTQAPDMNSIAQKRNAALDRTTEDVVAFVDDDDLWRSDKLRHQVSAMRSTGAVASCTGTEEFRTRWDTSAVQSPPNWHRLSAFTLLRGRIAMSSLVADGAVARRLRFDTRPEWTAVEDYNFKLAVARAGVFCRVDAPLTGIRLSDTSVSARDLTLQWARTLSVLADSASVEGASLPHRIVALQVALTCAFSRRESISDDADRQLDEALDGRLFGAADAAVRRVVRAGWAAPGLARGLRRVRDAVSRRDRV
jgi:hypothetical protein